MAELSAYRVQAAHHRAFAAAHRAWVRVDFLRNAAGRQHQRGKFCRCISFHGSASLGGAVATDRSQVVDPSRCEATMPVYSDILLCQHARTYIRADGPILIAPRSSQIRHDETSNETSTLPFLQSHFIQDAHLLHRCSHRDGQTPSYHMIRDAFHRVCICNKNGVPNADITPAPTCLRNP